jgi:hypothetical protein
MTTALKLIDAILNKNCINISVTNCHHYSNRGIVSWQEYFAALALVW